MYECILCVCLAPAEAKGRHHIPWRWSYRWLWVTIWALRTHPRSSLRDARIPNYEVLSQAPQPAIEFQLEFWWKVYWHLSKHGNLPLSIGGTDHLSHIWRISRVVFFSTTGVYVLNI